MNKGKIMKPDIRFLVQSVQMHFDSIYYYYDKENGDVISISTDALAAAADSSNISFRSVDKDEFRLAKALTTNCERYIPLPDSKQCSERKMMESFCKTIENEALSEDMLANVMCKAGEKLFSKDIIKHKLEEKWAAYKNQKYEETIIKWCKKYNIGV